MNLDNICTTPHAQGFIKVGCELDPAFGERRTLNEFVVTARHHEQDVNDARLAPHPIVEKLAKQGEGDEQALREIPIRMFFNKTQNALGIKYQAYAVPGNAPVCSGNGKTAKRVVPAGDGTQTVQDGIACVGPEMCEFVQSGKARCNRQVRMTVQIEGQDDPLSVFEVRSSSLNTYRALRGQLTLLEKKFKGLRHVPLKLALWQGSNEASGYRLFSLMRLELDATGEVEAFTKAKTERDALAQAGVDDDVDAALCPSDGDEEEALLAAADFQAVREFYEAPATRREGTAPVVTSTRRRSAAELGSAGSNAIAAAVRQSTASGTTAGTPTGATLTTP
jgi:hypothetical protein